EATRDPFGPVRWYAAIGLRALAEHHPAEQAVPALIDLLEDASYTHLSADRAINEQAARTLQAIDTPQARQAVDAWWAEQDDWF
ncbi:MAG: HEAT repeat domain-containing protein, partial [Anaerolineae bacterium]